MYGPLLRTSGHALDRQGTSASAVTEEHKQTLASLILSNGASDRFSNFIARYGDQDFELAVAASY